VQPILGFVDQSNKAAIMFSVSRSVSPPPAVEFALRNVVPPPSTPAGSIAASTALAECGRTPLFISSQWVADIKAGLEARGQQLVDALLSHFTGASRPTAMHSRGPNQVEISFPLPLLGGGRAILESAPGGEVQQIRMELLNGTKLLARTKPDLLPPASSPPLRRRNPTPLQSTLVQQARDIHWQQWCDKLKAIGFKSIHIDNLPQVSEAALTAITANNGEKKHELKQAGFLESDIVKTMKHRNGAQTLAALTQSKVQELRQLRFTIGYIVQMVNHDKGAEVLAALTPERVKECLGWDLQPAEIVKLVDHPCGVQVLDALTQQRVVQLRAQKKNVVTTCVKEVFKTNLERMGFDQKQVNRLMRGSLPLAKALTEEKVNQLKAWGFSEADIARLLGTSVALNRLIVLMALAPTLTQPPYQFSAQDIQRILSQKGGQQSYCSSFLPRMLSPTRCMQPSGSSRPWKTRPTSRRRKTTKTRRLGRQIPTSSWQTRLLQSHRSRHPRPSGATVLPPAAGARCKAAPTHAAFHDAPPCTTTAGIWRHVDGGPLAAEHAAANTVRQRAVRRDGGARATGTFPRSCAKPATPHRLAPHRRFHYALCPRPHDDNRSPGHRCRARV
jgi:hypothetical protein